LGSHDQERTRTRPAYAAAVPPITIVDVEPFRRGDDRDRARVAAEIDAACRGTGFLQLTGHGIPDALCREMLDVTGRFFDQPVARKLRCVVADKAANRGYARQGSEALSYSLGDEIATADLFEAFNVGRENTVGPYYDRHRRFFAPNVWPDQPAELRATWLAYERAADGLARTLLRAFAQALDLSASFFLERTEHAIATLRGINYERRPDDAPVQPGQLRMGAHTDYGILTVLLADDVPGLQILQNGSWCDVATPAGTLLINIGDMLARWTNDRWHSTMHRVVPPAPDVTDAVRRRSVARFLEPDPDCVIACLPSCCSPDNPARYEAVEAGEWLLAKLLGPREMRPTRVPT
jgi:isopenicillin N synthase-like dioxygenase